MFDSYSPGGTFLTLWLELRAEASHCLWEGIMCCCVTYLFLLCVCVTEWETSSHAADLWADIKACTAGGDHLRCHDIRDGFVFRSNLQWGVWVSSVSCTTLAEQCRTSDISSEHGFIRQLSADVSEPLKKRFDLPVLIRASWCPLRFKVLSKASVTALICSYRL